MLTFFKKIWTPVFIGALHLILFSFTGIAATVFADAAHPKGISTDGSLGQKIHLQGPDYEIKAEYGKQAGRNLFHSFQRFNIHSNESAVFTGSRSVQNIISRITGGETSWIDGKLGSEIAGADLYLLNPAGIMFGPNACLDLTGSFHVGTADYLKMDENDQFFSQPIENELLSSAPPSAFGFLGNNASQISFEGRGQISEDEWDGNPSGLSVPEGKTISVVGGDIEIKNGAWFEATEYNELGYVNPHGEKLLGTLGAPGGRINMTGIASAGEVSIENGKLETGDVAGGNIAVFGKSLIDVSGGGAGSVFIQSGKFVLDDSAVYGKNFGDKDGGRIEIQADNISVENGSEMNVSNYGQGNGVDVSLKASETIRFSGHDEFKNVSRIIIENSSRLHNAGNSGNLDIMAHDIVFSDGAYLYNTIFGSGNAGNIRLQAENDIRFGGMGYDPYVNYYGRLYSGENPINPEASFGGVFSFAHLFSMGGNGGDIEFKGNNIFLTDGVMIGAMTLGTGNAGSVRMIADHSILMDGSIGPGEWSGGISVLTFGGDAGDIFIKGADLTIKGGSGISANSSLLCTEGQCGKTGDVNIRLSGDLLVSGVNPYGGWGSEIGTDTGSGNPGGNIFIEAGSATIENGASITSSAYADGDGGNIEIRADDSVIVKGDSPLKTYHYDFSEDGLSIDYDKYAIENKSSAILSNSYAVDADSGNSGTVYVQAKTIDISNQGTIATSSGGGGNAGVVTVETGRLELKNKASIISESTLPENGGEAGAIDISADAVNITGGSAVSTEAQGANGGRIHVIAGDLLYLNNSDITSSVKQGAGGGGDITASSDSIILNHGGIVANAEQGDGGAIFIRTSHFLKSWDSTTQAASRRGNQGTVKIEAPDVDLTGGIADLPGHYIEPTQWLSTPCDQRTAQDASRFVITHPDGVPPSFDDLRSVVNERLFISRQRSSITDKGALITDKGDFAGLIHLLENEKISLGNAVRLANSYMAAGHYQKAGEALNAARFLAQLSEDAGEKALFYTVSGDLRLILKDMEGSVVDTKTGLALARRAETPLIAASALNGLGNIRNAGANWRRAVDAYNESLDMIDRSEAGPALKSNMKARVLINITRTKTAMGEYQKALSAAKKAAIEIDKQPDTYAKAANMLALHLAARKIPDFRGNQEKFLSEAARIGENIENHRIASLAWGFLGQYYEQTGDYVKALKSTRRAVFFAAREHNPEILYRWQWRAGRLAAREKDFEHAAALYEAAIDTVNPIRMRFFTGFREPRSGFQKYVKPLYLEFIRMLTEHAKQFPWEKTRLLAKTADTLEMLKKSEIQDFYRDECLEKHETRQSVERIPAKTAVLYPIPLPNQLILLLIFPDNMKDVKVPISSAKLEKRAERLHENLQLWGEDYLEDAESLYDSLIRPAKAELDAQGVETLIVVPDAALSPLPFSVLHSGTHFLIEEYALAVVPALGMTDTGQDENPDRSMLLGGLSQSREGFAPLENVEKELASVARLVQSRTLLNKDFTLSNLEMEIANQDYDTLHLATHAVFGDSPENTFLLTYDGRLTLNALDRLTGMKKYQDSQLDLLVLSACETAAGDARAAFGLAGSAVRAGVRSVLATLWKVDDRAASLIIEEFYRQLVTKNQTKAGALREAQKKFIHDKDFAHPAYWSPFLLVGDWR